MAEMNKATADEAAGAARHPDVAPLDKSKGPVGSIDDIKEHMEVYSSNGKFVGKVDHVQGGHLKLTKRDDPDGRHHLIPLGWVAKVHDHIHLNKNGEEVKSQWKPV